MNVSQLHRYSIGIAAENKSLKSRQLAVTPIEVMSALDGELKFNPEDTTWVGMDETGDRYEVKATQDITLTAEWLPLGSNRVTPPDIRRGELVEIYQAADNDQYFWRCMGLRDHLRRLETVILAINANPNESGTNGVDVANCYFLEVSSHQKLITMQTSQANGEPFGYTCQLNTGAGEFTLTDTIGNSMHLNSGAVLWDIRNAADTQLRLDREFMYAYAPQDITLRADNDVIIEAGRNVNLRAGQNADMEAGNRFTLKCGGSTFEMVPSNITAKAGRIDLNP